MEPSVNHDPVNDSVRTVGPKFDKEEARLRAARISALGLELGPDEFLDGFARELAGGARDFLLDVIGEDRTTVAPVAFVNLITVSQFASGLSLEGEAANSPDLRFAPFDTGYCPHVITRKLAMILDDVCDYPRFASNPIIDALGVRTYVGAPLIDDETGTPLGTVCVVDREAHPWGRDGLEFIKGEANELMRRIYRRRVSG
jgi:GAF domain-containing protein